MVGDQVIMPVWAFEAKVEGKPANELARDYADKIRQAIVTYQREHSFHALAFGALKTLVALVFVVLLFLVLLQVVRRINRALWATQRIQAVKIGNFEFFTAERIKAILMGPLR